MIVIYTDGGCSGNPGPGGWAFVVSENGEISIEVEETNLPPTTRWSLQL